MDSHLEPGFFLVSTFDTEWFPTSEKSQTYTSWIDKMCVLQFSGSPQKSMKTNRQKDLATVSS